MTGLMSRMRRGSLLGPTEGAARLARRRRAASPRTLSPACRRARASKASVNSSSPLAKAARPRSLVPTCSRPNSSARVRPRRLGSSAIGCKNLALGDDRARDRGGSPRRCRKRKPFLRKNSLSSGRQTREISGLPVSASRSASAALSACSRRLGVDDGDDEVLELGKGSDRGAPHWRARALAARTNGRCRCRWRNAWRSDRRRRR